MLLGKVTFSQWHNTPNIVAIIKGLVFAFSPPEKNNNQESQIFCRKTDPDMNKICLSNSSDIFLTGKIPLFFRKRQSFEKVQISWRAVVQNGSEGQTGCSFTSRRNRRTVDSIHLHWLREGFDCGRVVEWGSEC